MDTLGRRQRQELADLATEAMRERGLAPEYDAATLAQLAAIDDPAEADGPDVRDLTGLAWCSIDNDDSRDLDQLTVAEALPDGEIRLYVAIADVDALVEKARRSTAMRRSTPPRSIRRHGSSRCCRRSCRPT